MARENVSWGYDRIQGALASLGHIIAPNTVKNILKRHGIENVVNSMVVCSIATIVKPFESKDSVFAPYGVCIS
jgi:hypothetical protein